MSDFYQDAPSLGNQYDEDSVLKNYLSQTLPSSILKEIEPGLRALGERTIDEISLLGKKAESEPPKHIPYDPWGRRMDEITVSDAWKELEKIAVEEKLVSTAYERKQGIWSRVHQFARVYLYGPSSAIFTCPLAMTDGAARALELYGDENLKQNAFRNLTSTNSTQFWTSGQWMTERTGGSDVSQTSTIARFENGQYRLYGTKWFTSATTSQMAMTLARIEGAPEGNAGLSLFYLELRNPKGQLNQIQVHRLKEKLGTKALPTAELTLNGTPATLVGGEGGGVRKISSLFNLTRIWNSVCAIGYMRRGIALAQDYSKRRKAFGRFLSEHPLHLRTLQEMQLEFEGCFHLVFKLAELLGKEEMQKATPDETALLRLLTPIAKLYTAKKAIAISSEVLECFGGAGYVEDTGIPSLLRDSQVLAIWEGTTNVLCLDALRAIQKENALEPFLKDVRSRASKNRNASCEDILSSANEIENYFKRNKTTDEIITHARELSFLIAKTFIKSLTIPS